ncbi:hypothetical protein [Aurantimonas marina]|uniref:hypothetical protein n=1 Tax=Aurantimonas marina TaxID=2780508 RepID=UPI0019D1776B|nr:hypothetical protein [Aurantimonas marina]
MVQVVSLHPSDGSRPLPPGDGGGKYDGMEARVSKLENDMTDIRVTLGRIDERTLAIAQNMAGKADLASAEASLHGRVGGVETGLSTRVGAVEGELKRTLGFWQFFGVMAAAVALILAWPKLSALLGV